MTLELRREPEIVPSYSLTGDLLSFLRCGLQYRYHNGSALPPSRPVQLWFGEFIHGVLEGAFRIWTELNPPFPWPSNQTPYHQAPPAGRVRHDIGEIGDVIEETLRAQGKSPRSTAARNSAYTRAERAVNDLGPYLFPLISVAEERVIGTREVPAAAGLRAKRYELHGVIDVVTDLQLTGADPGNLIREAIQRACPNLAGRYEVVVDYKGSRRPASNSPFWEQGGWQVQTYAWLRTRQPASLPVAAGLLVYINELAPAADDLETLKDEIRNGQTDVVPAPGSPDYYALNAWQAGAAVPQFSFDFRVARALRVVPVTAQSQDHATSSFDKVVRRIEGCVANEEQQGTIAGQWEACGDDETCAACDFRHFCPNPSPRRGQAGRQITAPPAP